jgi:hypothetical protein
VLILSQSVTVGDYIYLFGGANSGGRTNIIYRAPVSDPLSWVDTGSVLPGNLSESQLAVIGDYIYLFGGYNGSVDVDVIYRAPTSNLFGEYGCYFAQYSRIITCRSYQNYVYL